jgi:hypothetical protein
MPAGGLSGACAKADVSAATASAIAKITAARPERILFNIVEPPIELA